MLIELLVFVLIWIKENVVVLWLQRLHRRKWNVKRTTRQTPMSYIGLNVEVRGKILETNSVLYCVLKLCTVISTLRWAVRTVLCTGFCHTGPISLCVDLFVYICVYFVCLCFILHSCIIVRSMGWTWQDLFSFSALTLLVKSFDMIWPIMCLVGR